VREPDGLALSSRNRYLNEAERRQAAVLFRALGEAQAAIAAGQRSGPGLGHQIEKRVAATPGAVLDYVAVVDANTLQAIDRLRGRVLIALAVKFGATRLIDNLLVDIPGRADQPATAMR
jgi:pantoate--beta-alanine ligase